ncbi:MAG: hypothetical protein JSS61_04490 [Verrucomicrobia bacterium]|nr:hypothetical protein [Verrucomicrobiota bacterium]
MSCWVYGSDPGNFGLPVSQQPGPLISFGENIIGKGEVQGFLGGDGYFGEKKHSIDLMPGILYGITDACSLFFNVPVALSYRENGSHSSGLEDLFVQFEYAVYSRTSSVSSDQVTLVANASFPTGSSHKNPPTGFGAMGYFLGTTYNRTWTKWFCFTSYGVEFPTSHHGTRFGNQYLYQAGFGRNFASVGGWLLAWMVEIDGAFAERNRVNGATDRNSGGNLIYVTPSFWASSKSWIVQVGLGYAVQQNLFGNQGREGFLLALNLGRTF